MTASREGIIAHWPLSQDTKDHGPFGLPTRAEEIELAVSGARFDGRSSQLIVDHHRAFEFGTGDFSLAAWIETDATTDVVGDLISTFDPVTRRGVNLSIITNGGVTTVSQPNYRNLHFGIDAGWLEPGWTSCGRPGNAAFVMVLLVSNGRLYAGTFERGAHERGGLWRYEGGREWTALGNPVGSNAISSVTEFGGELFVGTGRYNPNGSVLGDALNTTPGGRVFRLTNEGEWIPAGHPGIEGATPEEENPLGFYTGKADEVSALTVFQGSLYCTSYHRRGVYRYEGGERWRPVGLGDDYVLSLVIHRERLYALLDGGGVRRYEGGERWSDAGRPARSEQSYSGVTSQGRFYVGTWPEAELFQLEGVDSWRRVGRVGYEREIMGMVNYNGKVYLGTLPMANVWRYDDGEFAFLGTIDHASAPLRRAWCFAVYQGRLFAGTLPSGEVSMFEAGKMATWDVAFPTGRHHVAAVKSPKSLRVYVDGKLVAESSEFSTVDFDLTNDQPLLIGGGVYQRFTGLISDVQLYGRALTENEILQIATAAS